MDTYNIYDIYTAFMDGPQRHYHNNGSISHVWTYKDGYLDGPCHQFYEDGTM